VRPADRQDERALIDTHDAVRSTGCDGQQHPRYQLNLPFAHREFDSTLDTLHGDRRVGVMLVYLTTRLECDEHNADAGVLRNRPGRVVRHLVRITGSQRLQIRDEVNFDQRVRDVVAWVLGVSLSAISAT
jgi:hypothetical protein